MMKKFVALAAFGALAACGGEATEAEAPVEEVVEEVAITAADGGPSHGTFTVTNPEGETSTEVLAEDGTFTSTNANGEVTSGTWEQKSPNEFCAKEEDDEEMACYAEEVNEEGVWTSTNPEDGAVSIVERVVEEASAEDGEAAAEE